MERKFLVAISGVRSKNIEASDIQKAIIKFTRIVCRVEEIKNGTERSEHRRTDNRRRASPTK